MTLRGLRVAPDLRAALRREASPPSPLPRRPACLCVAAFPLRLPILTLGARSPPQPGTEAPDFAEETAGGRTARGATSARNKLLMRECPRTGCRHPRAAPRPSLSKRHQDAPAGMSPLSHLGACLWSSGGSPLSMRLPALGVSPGHRQVPRAGAFVAAQAGRTQSRDTEQGLCTGRASPSRVRLSKCPPPAPRPPARPALPHPGVLSTSVHSGGGVGGAPCTQPSRLDGYPPGALHLRPSSVACGGRQYPAPEQTAAPYMTAPISRHPGTHSYPPAWAPSKPKSDTSPSLASGPHSDAPQPSVSAS